MATQAMNPLQLEYSLWSPLRVRLLDELRELGEHGLTVKEAVIRTARHTHDVQACLRPMIASDLLVGESDGPFHLNPRLDLKLRAVVERVLDTRRPQLQRERKIRHQIFGGMIGLDSKMQLVFETVQLVARLGVPVLIAGETGTGKELVAKAIHSFSDRTGGHFGAVNCAAVTETLFGSEMFGHRRGAFTGAIRDHVGLIERCHKGTLFLDEVGDLTLQNQVKLLRVIQEGTFTRVGDDRVRSSDFRIIGATHRSLVEMVGEREFREDLYYRLNVFQIQLPSLRERIGDLPYLIEGILTAKNKTLNASLPFGEAISITPRALERMAGHSWPGNIRELRNVVTRAAILAQGSAIDLNHLELLTADDAVHAADSSSPAPTASTVHRTLCDVEREHIRRVLAATLGNVQVSAKILGIARGTLYKKVKKYGIALRSLASGVDG